MKIYNIQDSLEEKVINKARDLYADHRFFDAYTVLMDAIDRYNYQSERLISACMELMYNTFDDKDCLQLCLYKMSLKEANLSELEYCRLLLALNSLNAPSVISYYLYVMGEKKAYKTLVKDMQKQIPNYKNCLYRDHVPKSDKPDLKVINSLSALMEKGRFQEIADTHGLISPSSYYYVEYKILQALAYRYMDMTDIAYQMCKDLYAKTDRHNEQVLHALIQFSLVLGKESATRFYLQKYIYFCTKNWVYSDRHDAVLNALTAYNRHQDIFDFTNFLISKYPYSLGFHYLNAISVFKLGRVDEAKDLMSKLELLDRTTFIPHYVLDAMDKYPDEVDYQYATPPSVARRLELAFQKVKKLYDQDKSLVDRFLASYDNVQGICNHVLTRENVKDFDILCMLNHKAINKILHKYLKSIYASSYKKYKLLVAMMRAGYDITNVGIVINNIVSQVTTPNKVFFDKYSNELFVAYTDVMGVFLLNKNSRFHSKALNTALYFFLDRINPGNANILNNKNALERILCTLYCVFFFDDYIAAFKNINAIKFTIDDFNKSAKSLGLAMINNNLYVDGERLDIYMMIKKYNKKDEKKD